MSRVYSFARELRKPESVVAQFFRDRFPHTREIAREFGQQVKGLPTLRPDPSLGQPPYSTIGTAIDYRLRYYFRPTIIQTMDAFRGAQYIGGTPGLGKSVPVPAYSPELMRNMSGTVTVSISRRAKEFFDGLDELVVRTRPVRRVLEPDHELELCRYCFVLALFEQGMRQTNSGQQAGSLLDQLPPWAGLADVLRLAQPEWTKDIGRMAWLFGTRHRRLFSARVRVNPHYTSRVGGFGADADLMVNGYIIDIKSSLKPVLEASWLYQVVGYALLDFNDSMNIEGVGFYLARQGVFVQWSLAEILQRLSGSYDSSLTELRGELHDHLLTKLNYR